MNIKRLAGILILLFAVMMGCSGNYGKVETQSEVDSKVTKQELIDNWSDYNIWLSYYHQSRLAIIAFDPKNDGRKILVGSNWSKVKDQEMWTKIVKATTTSDGELNIALVNYDSTTRVQEIWGLDNQPYGFVIPQTFLVDWVNVKQVEENTIQLSWQSVVAHPSH